jgi:lysozyme
MATRLDKNGAALSASYEAIYLYSYPDPATGGEPITCGIGHTAAAGGMKPRMGQTFTMRQVMDIFRQDMGRVEKRVNKALKREQPQIDLNVWCSFDLNTGAISSGTVDDLINAGDREGAITKLGQYTRAAGKVNQGLVNRRRSEQAILRTQAYPSMRIQVRDRPGAAVRYISAEALPWDEQPAPEVALDLGALKPLVPPPAPVVPLPVRGRENFIVDLSRALWNWIKK